MAIGNFIKNNLALVAGLAIPVVLVAGFLASVQLGRMFTDPPRHLAYFVVENRSEGGDVSLHLDTDAMGKITARAVPVQTSSDGNYRPPAQRDVLIAYDFATQQVTELAIDAPATATERKYAPSEYNGITLTKGAVSPDGYAVSYGSNRRGFVGDIFSYNYGYTYRANKGAASYALKNDLPPPGTVYRYYTPNVGTRFLGWSATPSPAGKTAP